MAAIVRLLALEARDLGLVERWLRAEHVRRYWGDPAPVAVELSRLPPSARASLIEADGRKVGLIVRQHPTREELDVAGLHDIPETVVDIDIMVGEAAEQNRGVGRAAIRLIANEALADPNVPLVMAATMVENVASRRAFAAAGFSEEREFDDVPYGRCLLMTRRRGAAGGDSPKHRD
ncbi:acetyltransferase [candidate division WOR-3 bacterium]|uniref:Acetyltransferase n=1 Tax=candidate division WOR-3 bacterium TaxID=2052148 RepID=A0A937XE26_UNCW3|nr:acetyltransferase [candidate division WOR-3 bacterium]